MRNKLFMELFPQLVNNLLYRVLYNSASSVVFIAVDK